MTKDSSEPRKIFVNPNVITEENDEMEEEFQKFRRSPRDTGNFVRKVPTVEETVNSEMSDTDS